MVASPQGAAQPGTLVLHVLGNVDRHACYFQVGTFALDRGIYDRPIEDYADLTLVPGVQDVLGKLQMLRAAVFQTLAEATDRDLYSPRYGERIYWWKQHRRLSLDAYHRVVWHASAHIRQIWCLRGAMGAFDSEHFPRQFWH